MFESVIFIPLVVIFSSRFLYSQCTLCSAYRYHVHLTLDVSEQQCEDPLSIRELLTSLLVASIVDDLLHHLLFSSA